MSTPDLNRIGSKAVVTPGLPPKSLKPTEPKSSGSISYAREFVIWGIGFVVIHGILLLPAYRGDHVDAATAGVFGDFIGGYVGQIISLTGLCFLIGTFRTEIARAKRERFENRYFELLQLHRANVGELELKEAKGRKVFVLILREWRCILNIVRFEAQQSGQKMTQFQLLQISYYCLFYGVGPNSSRMLRTSLIDQDQAFVNSLESRLNDDSLKEEVKKDRNLGYLPFEGHQSRLGHYYRQLYQLVKFVERNAPPQDDVMEYMRTIRAQLSTHEQALLLLNSLTSMGGAWWNNELIDGFCMVHNIPKDFFDSELELDPSSLFELGYFETVEPHAIVPASLNSPFRKAIHLETPIWLNKRVAPQTSESVSRDAGVA